jgi:hypothetical protein
MQILALLRHMVPRVIRTREDVPRAHNYYHTEELATWSTKLAYILCAADNKVPAAEVMAALSRPSCHDCPGPLGAVTALRVVHSKSVCVAVVYGRTGCLGLPALCGGFRPGQSVKHHWRCAGGSGTCW